MSLSTKKRNAAKQGWRSCCCTAVTQKSIMALKAAAPVVDNAPFTADLFPSSRQCSIRITNKTSHYTLCNPSVYVNSGYCAEPLPPSIDPLSFGNALFNKTAHAARGAVGVFTYDLLNKSTKESTEKIAVMFSVPYDYNLYSNWYAVGIFDESKKCDHALYDEMYNKTNDTFVRDKAGTTVSHRKGRVAIMASMADSSQPIMKVEVHVD